MTRLHRAFVVLTISAIFMLCYSTTNYAGRKVSLKGRISAYRLADRMFQVASSVENRELFLFQVEGKNAVLVKLVYVHPGYSDIKANALSGAENIEIVVHRNVSCDETLYEFERDAPAIPIEGDVRSMSAKIIFTEERSQQLPKSYPLKCYVLDQWKTLMNGDVLPIR
jgi:hypothetical protein